MAPTYRWHFYLHTLCTVWWFVGWHLRVADSHHQKATLTCLFWAVLHWPRYNNHPRQSMKFMSKSIRGGKGYGSDLGFLPQETSFRTSTLLISHRYDFIHSNLSILARYTKIAGFRIGQAAKKGEEWARVSKRVTLHIYCFMHLAWLKMLWQKLWWWWRYIPLSNDDDDDESNDEEEVAPYRVRQWWWWWWYQLWWWWR